MDVFGVEGVEVVGFMVGGGILVWVVVDYLWVLVDWMGLWDWWIDVDFVFVSEG